MNRSCVLMTVCISLLVCGNLPGTVAAESLPSQPAFSQCLHEDTKLSDIVSAQLITSHSDGSPPVIESKTVEEKLRDLNASCRGGKLVDGNGREIYFYRLIGCWGNPPHGYQDILRRQQDAINKLKERYTVIEMTCNPSGLAIQ